VEWIDVDKFDTVLVEGDNVIFDELIHAINAIVHALADDRSQIRAPEQSLSKYGNAMLGAPVVLGRLGKEFGVA